MARTFDSTDIRQLLAEADDLIRRIDSEAGKGLKEEHRLQVEKHVQVLKKIRSEVHGRIEKKEPLESFSGAEGMHEAIRDIVRATEALKKYLF